MIHFKGRDSMKFRNLDLSTCIDEERAVALLEKLKNLLPPDRREPGRPPEDDVRLYDGRNQEKQTREFEQALLAYLRQFVAAHNSVSSYAYTSLITHAVNLYGKQIAASLESLLEKLPQQMRESEESMTAQDLPAYFTAYYALSIYYKHYTEITKYESMTKRFQKTFQIFPLNYEVLSGYYKRKEDFANALKCDCRAIESIAALNEGKHIGVCFSYASTVSLMMELGDNLEEETIQKALQYTEDAMEQRPRYGKFKHVYGKLLLFRIKPEAMSLEEVKSKVAACKGHFQRAIECESNQTQDYFSRKLEFEASKLKADAILYQAQSYHDLRRTSSAIIEEMKQRNSAAEENYHKLQKEWIKLEEESAKLKETHQKLRGDLLEENRKTEAKMLQLLALFTAVMSIILNSVYAAASQKDVVQSIFIILTMVACVVLIVSCLFIFCPALAGSALKIGKPHVKSRRKPDNAPAGAETSLLPSRAPFCIAAGICIAAIACILFFSYRYTTNILPSIQAGAPGVSSSAAGGPSSGAAAP